MEFGGQALAFHWPTKSRIPWIVAAVCCMLASSYAVDRLLGIAGFVSAWTGVPRYADQIRQLNEQASWWAVSAMGFVLVAALLLGVGIKAKSEQGPPVMANRTIAELCRPEEWIPPLIRFTGRLVISILGTVFFVLVGSLVSHF